MFGSVRSDVILTFPLAYKFLMKHLTFPKEMLEAMSGQSDVTSVLDVFAFSVCYKSKICFASGRSTQRAKTNLRFVTVAFHPITS